jgi:hypothetical protein
VGSAFLADRDAGTGEVLTEIVDDIFLPLVTAR